MTEDFKWFSTTIGSILFFNIIYSLFEHHPSSHVSFLVTIIGALFGTLFYFKEWFESKPSK